MSAKAVVSWIELGGRVARARRAAGLTQEQLGDLVGLGRTAVSKIEAGDRAVDALELSAIARILRRPVEWFVSVGEPAVVSRRTEAQQGSASGPAPHEDSSADAALDALTRDVDLLVELRVLVPPDLPPTGARVTEIAAAEAAALDARRRVGRPSEPLRELAVAAEALGLYMVCQRLDERAAPEGCYRALPTAGVALINGDAPPGRRRFTAAHEIGHHVLSDAYSVDWKIHDSEESERVVNAFAIHFLMPRPGVVARWNDLRKEGAPPRDAAVVVAAEYGVSWTAACAQLERFQLVAPAERSALLVAPPREGDYRALEVSPPDDLAPPFVSPRLSAAAIKAYRKLSISAGRAVEILRGTLAEADLPDLPQVPLDAFRSELGPV